MKGRRGFTLIEMVIVMTVGSVVTGLAVVLLGTLLHTENISRDHARQSTTLSRLAEQFRGDVRAATAVGSSDATSWEFAMEAPRTVIYRAESDALVRLERNGEELLRQERFSLPSGTAASMQIDKQPSATTVSLIVAPIEDDPPPRATRMIRFDAPLGADHRFHRPEPSSEDPNG